MDNTGLALQNQAAVNDMFAKGLAPIGNYAAQNLQLGIAQQRAEQERAQRIYEMQMQNQFQKQREADQYDYNRRLAAQAEAAVKARNFEQFGYSKDIAGTQFGYSKDIAGTQFGYNKELAKQAEDASFQTNKFIQESTAKREADQARLNFSLQDQKLKDQEANTLRENPDVKRILGTKINEFKDTPEGNSALIDFWHTQTADPKVQEDLAVGKGEVLAKQIKATMNSMTALNPGSPEAKEAVRAFLAQPGVVDMLIKKGALTQNDVMAIQQGGDPSKVFSAIRAVGDNSFWSITGDTRTASLLTSWNNALIQSKAVPSGEALSRMNYLQGLLKNFDAVLPNLTSESSYQRLSKAFGITSDTPKLPPAPIGARSITTAAAPQNTADNPFSQPAPQGQTLTPLGRAMQPSPLTTASASLQSLQSNESMGLSNKDAAFYPKRVANDPNTEFEVRRQLLDQTRKQQAVLGGASQGFYQPKYDAFAQMKDEDNLKQLVMGLYSPQNPNPQNILQNPFQGPQGIPNILGP